MACFLATFLNPSPFALPTPWWTITGRLGVKRAASFCQLLTTDVGQMMSTGRRIPCCQSL